VTHQDYSRPNPDALLEKIKEESIRAQRGKLRIYFGASAGVGKTFAMLSAAQRAKDLGEDVVVGLVETHNRAETVALVKGLEVLSRKTIEHKGHTLLEFDLDAAIVRSPEIILVDELAHSNVEGSRHPKRWQDIQELLDKGIDVWSALNVQHLESLNGTIGSITGIRIHETVPDIVLEQADEVIMVDVTADELLGRLKAGKVYIAQQAERAQNNFFKKGNLIALREIALRKTAERVSDEVRSYRVENSTSHGRNGEFDVPSWHTSQSLLVCVGPEEGAEHAVRSAARLAGQLSVRWYVVYVETPALQRLQSNKRDQILAILKLAEDLGATTSVVTGNDIALEIHYHAQKLNCATILLGRPRNSRLKFLSRIVRPTLTRQLANLAPELDIIEVSSPKNSRRLSPLISKEPLEEHSDHLENLSLKSYISTLIGVALTTLIVAPLSNVFDLANIVMIFLLYVVVISVKYGRKPAMLAAILAVLCFDFFYVPPQFSFAVSDAQYLITFAIMFGVGLLIGQLTANLKFSVRISEGRERRANSLFELTRELSAALQIAEVKRIGETALLRIFAKEVKILIATENDILEHNNDSHLNLDSSIADWSFHNGKSAGFGTNTLSESSWHYIPLIAPMRTRGVIALIPKYPRWLFIPEQIKLLETMARQIAIALERVHYVEIAQQAVVEMESEHLRNTLLATISHDLRTPLTTLIGFAETLSRSTPPLSSEQSVAVNSIFEESKQLFSLVNNLLEMAKLQSGKVNLRKNWQSFEEIIGASIHLCKQSSTDFIIKTKIPEDLPLIYCDAVLMERVFVNLIENSIKYGDNEKLGNNINIFVEILNNEFVITFKDNGNGFPVEINNQNNFLFEKFTRGQVESSTRGVGLGLSICKAIIEAHSGSIEAKNASDGGAELKIRLPLESQPILLNQDS